MSYFSFKLLISQVLHTFFFLVVITQFNKSKESYISCVQRVQFLQFCMGGARRFKLFLLNWTHVRKEIEEVTEEKASGKVWWISWSHGIPSPMCPWIYVRGKGLPNGVSEYAQTFWSTLKKPTWLHQFLYREWKRDSDRTLYTPYIYVYINIQI